MSDTQRQVPIAVVGIGALVPGARDAAGYWRAVVAGRDMITDVPASRWRVADHYDPDPTAPDKTYARRGAFLNEVDFDPLAHGIPPTNLSATDSAQLLALVVAEQVLADAGGLKDVDRERVGVVLGAAALELLPHMYARTHRPVWHKALRESGLTEAAARAACERIAGQYTPWRESTFPGLLGNVVAGRIANRFDLHGTNHTTDAACASSLAALSTAVAELSLGRSDLVISGGVDTGNDIGMFVCFSKTPALSPTGDCRPFSEAADGTMLGEAVVMYALKRLSDAERDGDRVHALIRGIGTSSDGRSTAIYAPLPAGQARALRRAYEEAGYGPDTVELVEAHGTGTRAGDAAELAALREVFGSPGHGERPWCALGSVKSQIGHTKCAAGAAGLLKAVMALRHKVLPPTIKVERPAAEVTAPGSPFYVSTRARPWVRPDDHPRRASVSSFGFGGSNFHVALEEYVPSRASGRTAWRHRTAPTELVLFSASSVAALPAPEALADGRSLAEVARGSQSACSPTAPVRLAVVAEDTEDLAGKYAAALAEIRRSPDESFSTPAGTHYAAGSPEPGRIAFLFPGQGAQFTGMGADLAMFSPDAQRVWDRHGGGEFDGIPLHRVVFPPPAFTSGESARADAVLDATEWAQPALAVHALALLDVLRGLGLRPDCVAGHSFGELVALHCAGVLDAESLLAAARRRGVVMRDTAVAPGAMLAVAADRARVRAVLAASGAREVWPANDNAPRQVVLSGTLAAIADAERAFAAEDITTRRLRTSLAFHSPLVAPAADALAAYLGELPLSKPDLEVWGNADAAPYPTLPDEVRRTLARHLTSPVRFREQVEAMHAAGVRTFVEVGAGHTLTGLVGQILGDRAHTAVALERPDTHGVTGLHSALGRLAVAGVPLDFAHLWAPYGPARTPEKEREPRMTVKIGGANHRDPLPPQTGPGTATDTAHVTERREHTAPPAPTTPPTVPEPRHEQAPGDEAPGYERTRYGEAPTAYGEAAPSHGQAAPSQGAAPAAHGQPVPAYGQSAPAYGQPVPTYGATSPAHGQAPFPSAPVPPPSSPVPPAVPAPSRSADWYALVESVQRQTAEAHTACQRMLIDSHTAFLRMSESTLCAMLGVQGGAGAAGLTVPSPALPPSPSAPSPLPVPAPSPSPPPLADTGTWPPAQDHPAPPHEVPAPEALPRPPASFAAPVPSPAPPPSVPAVPGPEADTPGGNADGRSLSTGELEELLLSVVARLTGYPAPMLGLDMELEADLGVDSIKRVEILSAVRRQLGDVPTGNVAELGKLRTLREITRALTTGTTPETGHPPARDALTPERPAPAPVTMPEPAATPDPAPAPPPAPEPTPTPPAPTRLVTRMVETPASGLAPAGLGDGPLVVTEGGVTGDSGRQFAALVARRLTEHGVEATATTEVPDDARGVIHLGGLTSSGTPDEAGEVRRSVFRAARAVARRMSSDGGVFVTVQDTGGDFGLDGRAPGRAWLGGIAALAATAGKEWPGATVRAVDCEAGGRAPEAVADALVREVLEGGSEGQVGLRADGTRAVPRAVPAPPATAGPSRVTSDAVIVASGGARGVTAAALLALAKAHRPRLVLLGRTRTEPEPAGLEGADDEPSLVRLLAEREAEHEEGRSPAALAARAREILAAREVRATVAALEAAGSPVRYVTVDVRDEAALRAALGDVRASWGPVTGLVHGAGVLADKHLADKTDTQFDLVLSTKVDGLRALLAATADDPLDLLCLFSSVAAAFGNAGQADYAMANGVLDHVASAESVRRPGCLVRSVAWGPWQGGMVTPALAGHFGRSGVALLPVDQGAAAFSAELGDPGGAARVVIAAGDAAPAADTAPRAARVLVRGSRLPQLADHEIAGVPVLPLAMALNWLTGAAPSGWRADEPLVLRDVRVYRKCVLSGLGGAGHRLDVRVAAATTGAPSRWEAELRDETGVPHVGAVLERADAVPDPGEWTTPEGLDGPASADVYDGHVLFHGPLFRSVRSLRGVSRHGAEATVVGAGELGWPGDAWPLDAAALDAALQVALLWAHGVLGEAALPMAVAECGVYRRGPARGPSRCVVRARKTHETGARCDVAVLDPDGAVRFALLGVELVRRPS
ncbi:polyketide-type polyunsaturated fatty acid synthase PfaA [Streptomyces sp. TverLS-915]|uniref:type I polyketide synthase n=1 Tax=Streptomyces sp. TverLS-915 TaxID=1839763 RepID=UPI00081D4F5A|nr:type I polyketide synthase [Streptomyces sp. TverLS-915]SCD39587.1 polyketide-type polyunsaturated fatty acid synthase PfaA [Streptomyces sp. TverLS-915]